MGWWIFWGIVLFLTALIVIPLSLRFRIRLSWSSNSTLDYTIVYGPIPLMPGFPEVTKEWFESKKALTLKILSPFIFVISLLIKLLKLLFSLFKNIIKAIKLLFAKKDKPEESVADKTLTDSEAEECELFPVEKEDVFPGQDTDSQETLGEPEPGVDKPEEEISQSEEHEIKIDPSIPEHSEGIDEDFIEEEDIKSKETPESKETSDIGLDKTPGEEENFKRLTDLFYAFINFFSSIGSKTDATWQRFESFLEKAKLYLGLWKQHKPIVKKTIRRLLIMLNGLRKKVNFREFEIRLKTGGDPAALGSTMGYHKALTGSIHPALLNHIHFDPDFEDYTFNPVISVKLDVALRPILLVGPVLRLLVTLPYLGYWRAYKSLSKELKDD